MERKLIKNATVFDGKSSRLQKHANIVISAGYTSLHTLFNQRCQQIVYLSVQGVGIPCRISPWEPEELPLLC